MIFTLNFDKRKSKARFVCDFCKNERNRVKQYLNYQTIVYDAWNEIHPSSHSLPDLA